MVNPRLEGFTLEEEALVRQWLEYKKVVLDRQINNPQSICQVNSICIIGAPFIIII